MKTNKPSHLIPMYAQIKEALQHEIAHRMKPGDALPTEAMLEKRFGVSRITIRRTLDELESEGLITRQRGRGTFVREPQATIELTKLVSWTAEMRQAGHEPQTLTCTIEVIAPPREVGAMLKMTYEEMVIRIQRLRAANNEPICLMTSYVRERILPTLGESGLVDGSLFQTLAAQNIKLMFADDRVEARNAMEWEAQQLQILPGASLLQIVRLAYDAARTPIVVDIITSRADRYNYTISY